MASRVTHFEIYGDAPAELASFYREALGWRIERAEGVDYWRIQAEAADAQAYGGGVTYRPSLPVQGWLPYVQVDSLDATLAAVERLGGRVVKEKTAVPRTAWYAVVADPAGNVFAIWQPDPKAFPPFELD
ncbi:MAG: VOC family protein [Proteobacteria bacterium]|nr:VOC family protein [Pseudomonadota bacterium]